MIEITSKSNNIIKNLKSLNEKKGRKINNSFYLEGIKIVLEVIEKIEKGLIKEDSVNCIIFSEEILLSTNSEITEKLIKKLKKIDKEYKIPMIQTTKNILEYISNTVTPQGVIVEIKKDFKENNFKDISKIQDETIIILDNIQDAGNLGTIIRTANAFDVKTIFCTKDTVDAYSPKVLRSTMGAILTVNVIYLNDEEILYTMNDFKNKGYNIFVTNLKAKKSITKIDYTKNKIFVFGNESNGVSNKICNLSTENVIIPMSNNQESLNVAISSGILLYNDYLNKNNLNKNNLN